MRQKVFRFAIFFLAAAAYLPATRAAVDHLRVSQREVLLHGAAFGNAGAYEKLSGTVEFALDPAQVANAGITDLPLAPRDHQGRVHATANFMVLQAVEPRRRRSVAFLEVSNRGGKAALRYFNHASVYNSNPQRAADFGDGLLLRQGLTVVWVGWQYDIPQVEDRLWLQAPRARTAQGPVRGLVRSDWTLDQDAKELNLGHRTLPAFYPVADRKSPANRLTVRDGRDTPRRVVPRRRWRFTGDGRHITAKGGFSGGHVYELVYLAQDPVVAGMGLAAVRDFMSYIKYDPHSPFPARRGIAFGVSQTGRFLRHFLYQGFNVDEAGRKVFDGMLIHSAGAGRGSFNHRFAQPSRDAHRYSAFFYPTDLFPFSTARQTNPVDGHAEGLLDRYRNPAHLPKLMETNSGYEYRGRAAAFIHAGLDGKSDLPLKDIERVYHLAGGQHFVERLPFSERKARGYGIWQGDPLDFLVNLRALALRLVDWVADDRPPPPSRYPRYADGTLVPLERWRFPAVPGVNAPRVTHTVYQADYGPRFAQGIIDTQPPRLLHEFIPPVPVVNHDGNERAGVQNVELRVPLASYLPWNLRAGLANPGELTDFRGTLVALPLTAAERKQRGDPRPSIAERYRDRADYLAQVRRAAAKLRAQGYLLREDIPRVLQRASVYWNWLACGAWRDPAVLRAAARLCANGATHQ